jgi:hypothetical protein
VTPAERAIERLDDLIGRCDRSWAAPHRRSGGPSMILRILPRLLALLDVPALRREVAASHGDLARALNEMQGLILRVRDVETQRDGALDELRRAGTRAWVLTDERDHFRAAWQGAHAAELAAHARAQAFASEAHAAKGEAARLTEERDEAKEELARRIHDIAMPARSEVYDALLAARQDAAAARAALSQAIEEHAAERAKWALSDGRRAAELEAADAVAREARAEAERERDVNARGAGERRLLRCLLGCGPDETTFDAARRVVAEVERLGAELRELRGEP